MELDRFTLYSPVHLLALFVCFGTPALLLWKSRVVRESAVSRERWRKGLVAGSFLSWLVCCGFWFHPDAFRWDGSLPLQYCNLANLIAAVAVGRQFRWAQALLYFWMFALCLWAFLTPFLMVGPAHAWFWVFWIYHLFIPLSVVWIFAVDRFRPSWSDLNRSLLLTLAFTLFLMALNAITGWNYGFVGAGKPGQPSPIDVLGPYPLRVLWMILIGALLFLFLLLPWLRRKPKS
ncbi:MAG: TIGR02206 family membrane protein [Verrucomicrobiota bacterium]